MTPQIAGLRAAAAAIGREIEFFYASTNAEIDTAFESLVQKRTDALLVTDQFFFRDRRAQIIALAVRHALPVIYVAASDVEAGGLMSYGPSIRRWRCHPVGYLCRPHPQGREARRPAGQQPTKFALVINLKTAKALSLTIPPTLLATADEVIE